MDFFDHNALIGRFFRFSRFKTYSLVALVPDLMGYDPPNRPQRPENNIILVTLRCALSKFRWLNSELLRYNPLGFSAFDTVEKARGEPNE